MSIDWYEGVNGGTAALGVEWNLSESATGVSYTPYVYLWMASHSQDSSMPYTWNLTAGGTVVSSGSTTLSYNIAGSTTTLIDSFATRYLSKTTGTQYLVLTCTFTDGYVYGESKINTTKTWQVSVPALSTYTVSYNANGGSGAPGSQSQYYGSSIALSSTKPTRAGHTFLGWATSSTGGVSYAPGATYSSYTSITLYAVWQINTYTIAYNANNGTGAPASQTKTYGVTLTLSSITPTHSGYNFLGWATSSTATKATYSAGGSYTANAAATLYAVWQVAYNPPRITNLVITRCTSDKTASDSGTYATVSFDWATDKAASKYVLKYQKTTDSSVTTASTTTISGTSGSVSDALVGSGELSADYDYMIYVDVYDANGNTETYATITGQKYAIDFLPNNAGAAMGKAAYLEDTLDLAWALKVAGVDEDGVGLLLSEGALNAKNGVKINDVTMSNFLVYQQFSSANNAWNYIMWDSGLTLMWCYYVVKWTTDSTNNVSTGNSNVMVSMPWLGVNLYSPYVISATIMNNAHSASELKQTIKTTMVSSNRMRLSVESSYGDFGVGTSIPVGIIVLGKRGSPEW